MFDTPRGGTHGLDDAQLAAVTHGDGPLVIMAGAGTGKTRTLTVRVARLLERGVPAERILLLTFTRRAADDMLARAAVLAGTAAGTPAPRAGPSTPWPTGYVAAYAEPLGLRERVLGARSRPTSPTSWTCCATSTGLAGTDGALPRGRPRSSTSTRGASTPSARSARCSPSTSRGASRTRDAIAALFRAYVARKRRRGQLGLRRPAALLARPLADEHIGAHLVVGDSTTCSSTSTRTSTALQVDIVPVPAPRRPGADGGGRRRPGHLRLPRRRRPAPARPRRDCRRRRRSSRLERNFRSRQPILELANVVRPGRRRTDA